MGTSVTLLGARIAVWNSVPPGTRLEVGDFPPTWHVYSRGSATHDGKKSMAPKILGLGVAQQTKNDPMG